MTEQVLRRSWLSRLGRWSAVAVVLGYAVALTILWSGGDTASTGSMLGNAFEWLVASGLLVALGAAMDTERIERRAGLRALALQRGFSDSERAWTRLGATARVVAAPMLWPAVALAALATAAAPTVGLAMKHSMLGVTLVGAAGMIAAALALVTRWSVALSPHHPRLMLLALLGGPHIASTVLPAVPSPLTGVSLLVDWILRLGAGVS
jgi:hypothetical protein